LTNLGLGRKVSIPPREAPIPLGSAEVDSISEDSSIRSTIEDPQHKVTRETFLEAAYQVCLKDEKIKKTIMREAQLRLEKRREESDIRKLQNLNDKMKQRQN